MTAGPAPGGATSLPALALVTGPEEVLVQRAVDSFTARARAADAEVVRLEGTEYEPGAIGVHASPSLFGGATCLVVLGLHEATDECQADLLAYLANPSDDVHLVVTHASGVRGKKVLDTLKKNGATVIDCPALKSDRDKSEFVSREFSAARRRITAEAVQALIEAVGKDTRELAAACAQLIADTDGTVTDQVVDLYHGGRVEATGFRVADAASAGRTAEALTMLRHAIASGVDPVPIVAILVLQVRNLIRVGGAGRGPSGQVAKALAMPPWQVEKMRRLVGGWSPEGLAVSLQALAAADVEVKGGGRDPVFALERAIITMGRAHARRD